MPKTKGTPHATSTVGATQPKTGKTTARRNQDAKHTARSSVHSSTKAVQPRAKATNRAAHKPSSRTKVTRSTGQSRAKNPVQEPTKQIVIHSYPDDQTWDLIMIASGVLVLLAVGFIAAKVLS